MEEGVTLFKNSAERRKLDDVAELYSIIRTVERLEYCYIRDLVSADEYTQECQNLISQFKTIERTLIKDGLIESVAAFIVAYNIDCPKAKERLLVAGVPATLFNGGHGPIQTKSSQNVSASLAADATSLFITALDAVNMNQRAVDQIHPLIQDLVRVLNKVEGLIRGFNREPLQKWLIELNAMRAVDELNDNQIRQLTFDLDNAYNDFMRRLKEDHD